jgi:F1F0 ATPase subunit 2
MTMAIVFLALGFLLGSAHFALLRANTQLYARSGAWRNAALLCALRLTLTVAALGLIAQAGAAALLAALVGILAARSLLLTRLVFHHG